MSSSSVTRRRKLPGPIVRQGAGFYQPPDPKTYVESYTPRTLDGIQVTVSEGHPWDPSYKKKARHDVGGPFYTSKAFVASPGTMPYSTLGPIYVEGPPTWRYSYYGPLFAYPTNTLHTSDEAASFLPPDLSSSDDDLDEKGATAIARCEPTNSVADLSTALTELMKDGLPALVGHQSWQNRAGSVRKNAAGEYLNVQFGLRPLLNDVSDFAKAVVKSDQILAQYERDAGRVVRRRYYFPSETSHEESVISTVARPAPNGDDVGLNTLRLPVYQGTITRHRETVRKCWFSGAFTYYLPSGYDSRNNVSTLAAKAEHLFGIKLSLETLWNVAPWSWAVDWFANTGDVIHNLEAFKTNGLILRYGYVMETTITTDTYSFRYNSTSSGGLPRVAPFITVRITKKRKPANPFGFGVQWNSLSPFQLSIAAALGLNRGRR